MINRSLRILQVFVPLSVTPQLLTAQLTVTGRVTDEAGRALAGAQLGIEGTGLVAVADDTGGYRLLVPDPRAGMVLVARLIGHRPAREALAQTTGVLPRDFHLVRDVLQLSAVVVTATRGETERSALGTTIATVTGEQLARAGTPQIDAGLAGQVPGALVQQASGTPGGGTSVRIRGLSTLSRSAEPLYIVDGVIVDNSSTQLIDLGGYSSNRLADLDPGDVERIEIVKGAAAAALYGSRANDGVVQIFTKRGRAGAARASYRVAYERGDVERRLDVNTTPVDAAGNPVTRFDYQDQIFRTAPRVSTSLSLSGGDERTAFFVSGSLEDQDGVVRGSDYRRQNLRLNLDRFVSRRLKVALSTSYIHSEANLVPNGGLASNFGVLTNFFFTPNSYRLFRDETTGQFPNGFLFANPLDVIANWRAPQGIDRFIGGLQVTATPLERLTIAYRLGYDAYTETEQQLVPRNSSAPALASGLAISASNQARLLNSDVDVSYVIPATPGVRLTHGVGMNFQSQVSDVVIARAEDLALLTETVQGSRQFSSQSIDRRRTLGFYAQEQIGIQDRLFLTASIRSDASSAFGRDERQQWFPKVGLSLTLSAFDFWERWAGAVSTLRLRGGLGYSGGQPTGSFDRLSNYVFEPSGTRSGVVNSAQRGNENLKPERARELEVGSDIELAGGRVGLELTYFDKRVTDLILPKTVRPSSGFTAQLANVGELTNDGFELLLRSFNLRTNAVTWSTTVTFATNDPVVTKLSDGGAFFIPESFNIIRVDTGRAPGHFFGTTYVRDAQGRILDPAGQPVRNASGAVVGIPAIGPRRVIGDPNTDAYWSLINEVSIGRRWSARIQFDGVRGGDLFNFDRRLLETPAFGTGKAYEAELLGDVPTGYFQARRSIFEEYIEDGSFVKLRELSITYAVPSGLVGRFGASSAHVSLIARNLKTWTDYTGWDPETNVGAQRTLVRGFGFATTPIPRTVALSVTATF
jgi:TonB-dependent SusC/RagA subfamily outer membrane receptor